jgi:hypothetical protein
MTDEKVKTKAEEKAEVKFKHPKITTLPELKSWLMTLSEKERKEAEEYVNKILPTLK